MDVDVGNLALARQGESPWELAKARFLEDLDPAERQLYDNATLENIYYATSNANRNDAESSKARAIIQKLQPLVSAIQSYGAAMDTFAQIAPLYLSPIWGCIRVLLVAAEAQSKFYAKIVDVLARVGDILPRFRDYERIYNPQKHARLTQALSNTYLDIITLCTEFRKAIRDHRVSTVRRLLKPLSLNQQFDATIEKFRLHKQKVEDEADTCHKIEAAEEREARLMLFAAERRRRLLARLSNYDCNHKHRRLQGTRHEGTGVWLSQHPEYVKWEALDLGSAVLCCYGIPGCGKSVLASTVIDSMKKTKTSIFYYCDYADKRTLFPSTVFGNLARQILEKRDTIPEALAVTIEEADHDGDRLIDHSKALHLLQQCIETLSHPWCIILDGLDECTESSQRIIFEGLRHLLHRNGSTVKLFITGRAELDASLKLKASIPILHIPISSSAIALDIESYVQATIRHRISSGALVVRDPKLEDLIVGKLVVGAQGMFLWVEFQLNDLCDAESDYGIIQVLDNLPRSLSETYDRLLGRIEGLHRATMIERMFKWLVCARQPLHVDELREAVAFTLDDVEWDPNKIVTDLNRLVRACSNLVTVDTETHVVQLAHYTVEQYLLGPETTKYHFTPQEADIMAGEFCIAYLSFSNFETRVARYQENTNTNLVALGRIASRGPLMASDHPGQAILKIRNALRAPIAYPVDFDLTKFASKHSKSQDLSPFRCLSYVSSNWLKHSAKFPFKFKASDDQSQRKSQRRGQLFQDLVLVKDFPFQFRPWTDCLPIDNTLLPKALFGWGLIENHPSLITLAYLYAGEHEVDKNSVRRSIQDDIVEGWHHFCTKYLSHTTFPRESFEDWPDGSYALDTPVSSWVFSRLLSACCKGHAEAIRACKLYEFLDVVPFFIFAAAIHGHLSLLQELLLHCHSTDSSVKIISNGFDLNAVEHAIISGSSDIARVLLNAGQEIELFSSNKSFFTLLNRSINLHLLEFLNHLFLLRSFAKEICKAIWASNDVLVDPRMANVLERAASQGRRDVAEILLRHGVNPNIPSESGRLPLCQAVLGSHLKTVKVLLEYNAAVRISSGLAVPPLTIAAWKGNVEIVNLLLSNNADVFIDESRIPLDTRPIRTAAAPDADTQFWRLYPTPLFVACFLNHLAVVRSLLRHGACLYLASPTRILLVSRHLERIILREVSLSHAVLLEFSSRYGLHEMPDLWRTPSYIARFKGNSEILEILREEASKQCSSGSRTTDDSCEQIFLYRTAKPSVTISSRAGESPMMVSLFINSVLAFTARKYENMIYLDDITQKQKLAARSSPPKLVQKTEVYDRVRADNFDFRLSLTYNSQRHDAPVSLELYCACFQSAVRIDVIYETMRMLSPADNLHPSRVLSFLLSAKKQLGIFGLDFVLLAAVQQQFRNNNFAIIVVLSDVYSYITSIDTSRVSPESEIADHIIKAIEPLNWPVGANADPHLAKYRSLLDCALASDLRFSQLRLFNELVKLYLDDHIFAFIKAIFVARKHGRPDVIKFLREISYTFDSTSQYRGPHNSTPLIDAVQTRAPMSTIRCLLDELLLDELNQD
ncbi:hypothetical protein EG329_002498 [Mollisiaceae sp. DMI_Dod_QoI]|nr:hypothetical protein EG329_002498 [Helotiales sp. DMI_Dod_QoI]